MSSSGNPDIDVELRVTEPDPLALPLGTAVLGSGGPGVEFYAEAGGADLLVQTLADAGWRVVDRKWSGGWITTTPPSTKQKSRRYAVLLEWIETNLHQGGKLVASGNSGGAAEIAYTLTTWEQIDRLDAAVLTGGPPLVRQDYQCTANPPMAWLNQCSALVPPGALACSPVECSRPIEQCQFVNQAASPAELHEDSILHNGARTDFGALPVHFAIGTLDCTAAVPQGLLLKSQVTSPTTVEFVANTPHSLASTPEGRAAIVSAFMNLALPPPAVPPASTPALRERIAIVRDTGRITVLEVGPPE